MGQNISPVVRPEALRRSPGVPRKVVSFVSKTHTPRQVIKQLIDNPLDANATEVQVVFFLDDKEAVTKFQIIDNGDGMVPYVAKEVEDYLIPVLSQPGSTITSAINRKVKEISRVSQRSLEWMWLGYGQSARVTDTHTVGARGIGVSSARSVAEKITYFSAASPKLYEEMYGQHLKGSSPVYRLSLPVSSLYDADTDENLTAEVEAYGKPIKNVNNRVLPNGTLVECTGLRVSLAHHFSHLSLRPFLEDVYELYLEAGVKISLFYVYPRKPMKEYPLRTPIQRGVKLGVPVFPDDLNNTKIVRIKVPSIDPFNELEFGVRVYVSHDEKVQPVMVVFHEKNKAFPITEFVKDGPLAGGKTTGIIEMPSYPGDVDDIWDTDKTQLIAGPDQSPIKEWLAAISTLYPEIENTIQSVKSSQEDKAKIELQDKISSIFESVLDSLAVDDDLIRSTRPIGTKPGKSSSAGKTRSRRKLYKELKSGEVQVIVRDEFSFRVPGALVSLDVWEPGKRKDSGTWQFQASNTTVKTKHAIISRLKMGSRYRISVLPPEGVRFADDQETGVREFILIPRTVDNREFAFRMITGKEPPQVKPTPRIKFLLSDQLPVETRWESWIANGGAVAVNTECSPFAEAYGKDNDVPMTAALLAQYGSEAMTAYMFADLDPEVVLDERTKIFEAAYPVLYEMLREAMHSDSRRKAA